MKLLKSTASSCTAVVEVWRVAHPALTAAAVLVGFDRPLDQPVAVGVTMTLVPAQVSQECVKMLRNTLVIPRVTHHADDG